MSPNTKLGVASAVWLAQWLMRYGNDESIAFAELLGEIAERRSLNEFCTANGIRPGFVLGWIRADEDRSRRYNLAVADRLELDREASRDVWTGALGEMPVDPPRWGDRLKASEMLAKHSGALKDGASSVNVNVGGVSLIALLSGLDGDSETDVGGSDISEAAVLTVEPMPEKNPAENLDEVEDEVI